MIKHALFAGALFLAGCGGGDDPKDAAAETGKDVAAEAVQDATPDAGSAEAAHETADAAAE